MLGLAAATFQIVTGVATDAVALTAAVAASYLAATAFGLPWMAWASIVVGSVVVTLSEMARAPWWLGLSLFGAALVLVGLVGGSPVRLLTAQGLALLGSPA